MTTTMVPSLLLHTRRGMRFLLFFIALQLGITLFLPRLIFASNSQVVTATVRLTICGDGVAEAPEQCDNSDLAGQSCSSKGYLTGDLVCDSACEFDLTVCQGTGVSPTPTPTPTSIITPTPTTTSTLSSDGSPTATPVPTNSISVSTIEVLVSNLIRLPSLILSFDKDGDGIISEAESWDLIAEWVGSWKAALGLRTVDSLEIQESYKRKCDISQDNQCDIIDFSVLLYYIDNT
jgi:hypothetical protein